MFLVRKVLREVGLSNPLFNTFLIPNIFHSELKPSHAMKVEVQENAH